MDVKGEVEAMIAPCLTSSAGRGAYFDDNQSLVVVEAEGIAICIFNKMTLLKPF